MPLKLEVLERFHEPPVEQDGELLYPPRAMYLDGVAACSASILPPAVPDKPWDEQVSGLEAFLSLIDDEGRGRHRIIDIDRSVPSRPVPVLSTAMFGRAACPSRRGGWGIVCGSRMSPAGACAYLAAALALGRVPESISHVVFPEPTHLMARWDVNGGTFSELLSHGVAVIGCFPFATEPAYDALADIACYELCDFGFFGGGYGDDGRDAPALLNILALDGNSCPVPPGNIGDDGAMTSAARYCAAVNVDMIAMRNPYRPQGTGHDVPLVSRAASLGAVSLEAPAPPDLMADFAVAFPGRLPEAAAGILEDGRKVCRMLRVWLDAMLAAGVEAVPVAGSSLFDQDLDALGHVADGLGITGTIEGIARGEDVGKQEPEEPETGKEEERHPRRADRGRPAGIMSCGRASGSILAGKPLPDAARACLGLVAPGGGELDGYDMSATLHRLLPGGGSELVASYALGSSTGLPEVPGGRGLVSIRDSMKIECPLEDEELAAAASLSGVSSGRDWMLVISAFGGSCSLEGSAEEAASSIGEWSSGTLEAVYCDLGSSMLGDSDVYCSDGIARIASDGKLDARAIRADCRDVIRTALSWHVMDSLPAPREVMYGRGLDGVEEVLLALNAMDIFDAPAADVRQVVDEVGLHPDEVLSPLFKVLPRDIGQEEWAALPGWLAELASRREMLEIWASTLDEHGLAFSTIGSSCADASNMAALAEAVGAAGRMRAWLAGVPADDLLA